MLVGNKYQLAEGFQSQDGEISIPGHEIATGRAVVMHLLVTGDVAENLRLRESAAALTGEHQKRVIETGFQEGVHFVVTAQLPGNPSLRAWLQSIATPTPVAQASAPPLSSEQPPATPSPVGEFTQFFSGSPPPVARAFEPAGPRLVSAFPASTPPVSPEQPPATPSPIGEFTQFFSGSPSPPSAPDKPSDPIQPAAPREPKLAQPPPPQPTPGEFTRFVSHSEDLVPTAPLPIPPPSPVSAPHPPPATSATPGEFTRFIAQPVDVQPKAAVPSPVVNWGTPAPETPKPAPPKPAPPPRAPAPTSDPGEFTRLFAPPTPEPLTPPTPSAPVIKPAPVQPAPTSVAPTPGEFTRFFQPGPAGPAAPSPVAPLFGNEAPRPLSAPPSGPGEFTRAMQSPLAPEPYRAVNPPPAAKTAPSEFTRMMQVGSPQPSQPVTPPPARPAEPNAFPWKPAQQAGEYTRIFESVQPKEDHFPPAQAPLKPVSSGEKTGLFANKPKAAPKPPMVPAGPGEYTRMVNASSQPKPPAAPPAAPKPTAATPASVDKSSSKLLFIGIGILVFAALILLVVFLVRG